MLLMENDDENKVFTIGFTYSSGGQYRTSAYFGAFSAVRVQKNFSGKNDPFVELVKGIS